MTGVPEAYFSILNPEVNRFFRLTLNNNGIIASVLELGTPESTNLRLSKATGERRFGTNTVPAAAW